MLIIGAPKQSRAKRYAYDEAFMVKLELRNDAAKIATENQRMNQIDRPVLSGSRRLSFVVSQNPRIPT